MSGTTSPYVSNRPFGKNLKRCKKLMRSHAEMFTPKVRVALKIPKNGSQFLYKNTESTTICAKMCPHQLKTTKLGEIASDSSGSKPKRLKRERNVKKQSWDTLCLPERYKVYQNMLFLDLSQI